MTREEATKWLKTFKGCTGMAELSQAFDVAIKALERESMLDKIRAEIAQLFIDDVFTQGYTINECLRIINKYMVESEGEE